MPDDPDRFLVERFLPGTTTAAACDAMEQLRSACQRLAATGVPLRFLGGTFTPGDEAMACRFEGTAQAVRAVHDFLGMTFDRLQPAVEVEPEVAKERAVSPVRARRDRRPRPR